MPDASKKNMVFVLGATANFAFTLGPALLALERHMRGADYDVLVISDDLHGALAANKEDDSATARQTLRDAELISGFRNCRIIPYEPQGLDRSRLPQNFPYHVLYRLEIFRLLDQYRAAIWLDSDIAIQGDLSGLAAYGPLAMAPSDDTFLRDGLSYTMGRNFYDPEKARADGYDVDAPFSNAGILVARDDLPAPRSVYAWCLNAIEELHENLRHNDQTVLNMFIQKYPDLFQNFSADEYNCYPLNPASLTAKIVHCFGARKFWNDGLLRLAFPEWHRDYLAWLGMGGSKFPGEITDNAFIRRGTYPMLCALVEKLNSLLEK